MEDFFAKAVERWKSEGCVKLAGAEEAAFINLLRGYSVLLKVINGADGSPSPVAARLVAAKAGPGS